MRDLPIACTLTAAELGARRAGLLPGLRERALDCRSLDDGVRLTFAADSDTLQLITRVIDAERQCCGFMRFVLTVEQAGAPIALDITGPSGTREFLESLFEPASE
jgi:hypothetical protein